MDRFTICACRPLRYVSAKQSRETVRDAMPERYADVLNELLYSYHGEFERGEYSHRIVRAIIDAEAARAFIIVLCEMIQRLSVNYVHIIGDVFDRGKAPHNIMEELIDFGQVDIQWGNHDIMWMGAAAGNEVCMCSVLRANIAYNNFDALEDGYGLNLRALSSFAQDVYGDDPCTRFIPKVIEENEYDMVDIHLAAKMHKAIAILMFKLEMKLYDRNPEFHMDDRKTLYKTDFHRMVYTDNGEEYRYWTQYRSARTIAKRPRAKKSFACCARLLPIRNPCRHVAFCIHTAAAILSPITICCFTAAFMTEDGEFDA